MPLLFPVLMLAVLIALWVVGYLYFSDHSRLAESKRHLEDSRSSLQHSLDTERAQVQAQEVEIENLKGIIMERDDTITVLQERGVDVFSNILREALANEGLEIPNAPQKDAEGSINLSQFAL